MLDKFLMKIRLKLAARRQRKRDRAWLATDPSPGEIMRERNDRRTEWIRWQASYGDDLLFKEKQS